MAARWYWCLRATLEAIARLWPSRCLQTDRVSADVPDPVTLYDGLCTTRAIRRFRPDPIPDDDLAAILFAATRAPSGRTASRSASSCCATARRRPRPRRCSARRSGGCGRRSGRRTATTRGSGADADVAQGPHGRAPCSTSSTASRRSRSSCSPCLVRYRQPDPHRGGVGVPGVPEPAAGGAGARLRRRADHVARAASRTSCATLLGIPDDVVIAATHPARPPRGRPRPGAAPAARRARVRRRVGRARRRGPSTRPAPASPAPGRE